jgi:hypothetical protein
LEYSQFAFSSSTITLAVSAASEKCSAEILDSLASGVYGLAAWGGVRMLDGGMESPKTNQVAVWRLRIESYLIVLVVNFTRCLDKAALFKSRFCSTRRNGEWLLPVFRHHCGIVDHAKQPAKTLPENTLCSKV